MKEYLVQEDAVLKELINKGRSKTDTLKTKVTLARRDHLMSAREDLMLAIIDRAMELKYSKEEIFKIRLYVYDKRN